jgi:hypothetical protein
VTLRIETYTDGGRTTIRLIGRMRAEHLSEVQNQIKESGGNVTLDLEEVTLVDVQVVRFLGSCETRDINVVNCSPYITNSLTGSPRSEPEGEGAMKRLAQLVVAAAVVMIPVTASAHSLTEAQARAVITPWYVLFNQPSRAICGRCKNKSSPRTTSRAEGICLASAGGVRPLSRSSVASPSPSPI